MNTDPYDDDDDSPTLQRPPTASRVQRSLPVTFIEESATATDLMQVAAVDEHLADEHLADAHTVDSLPPADAVALLDSPDYSDMETPKVPLDVAALLLRASQDDHES